MIQVHKDLNSLPNFTNAVITIGTFDGVHLGHQQIIQQIKNEAVAIGGETVIITFHPHPRKIVASGTHEVKTINTLEEKIERLDAHGVEHLVVVPFTEAFASQPADEYIKNFLVDKFHPHTIIIGYDHKFGKARKGDYHLLENLGEKYNYIVKEIPEHVLNEVIISSTKVRDAISGCDISTANNFLGYEYFFEGIIVEGNKLGRTIGFPTANIFVKDEEKLIPGNGVYAVVAKLESESYKGMMNIGIRPTINGTTRVIEVNIFDFDKDIYGQMLKVFVKHYLRGEQKFNGLEELKAQLSKDMEEASRLLNS